MSNKTISDIILQAADGSGFYRFPAKRGLTFNLSSDAIQVTTGYTGKPFSFPRAFADTETPVIIARLSATAEAETVGPDGIGTWTAMSGSTVSVHQVRVQWQGQPGDTPPVVEGMEGLFTEQNRVEGP